MMSATITAHGYLRDSNKAMSEAEEAQCEACAGSSCLSDSVDTKARQASHALVAQVGISALRLVAHQSD